MVEMPEKSSTYQECWSDNCTFHKMPRYKCSIDNDSQSLELEAFILEEFYVQVNYKLNFTKIHKLDVVVLSDTVPIEQAISFNLKNLKQTLDKLRMLVTFS
jgi:hypothetical protein